MAAATEIKLFGKWSFDEVEVSLQVLLRRRATPSVEWHAAAQVLATGQGPLRRSAAALELMYLQDSL